MEKITTSLAPLEKEENKPQEETGKKYEYILENTLLSQISGKSDRGSGQLC